MKNVKYENGEFPDDVISGIPLAISEWANTHACVVKKWLPPWSRTQTRILPTFRRPSWKLGTKNAGPDISASTHVFFKSDLGFFLYGPVPFKCHPSGFRVHKLLQERDSFKQLPRKCSQAVDIKVYKSSGSNTYPFIAMSKFSFNIIKYYKFSFQFPMCICVKSFKVQVRCFHFVFQFSTALIFSFQAMVNLGRSLNCQSFVVIIKGLLVDNAHCYNKGALNYNGHCW